jgi:uncharacterized membrane protein
MKAGIKTTEFWVTLVATIIVAAGAEFGLELETAAVAGVVTMVVTYIISRLVTKKDEVKKAE